METQLTLHEELLLLALKDAKGTIDWRAGNIGYLLTGAVFAEMLLSERVELSNDKKPKVSMLDSSPMGDPLSDSFLAKVHTSTKEKTLQAWIQKLTTSKNREQVAQGLCRKRILKEEEHKILGLFTTNRYPEVDHRAEAAVIERLRRAVKGIDRQADARTTVLISLLHKSRLLSLALPKSDIKDNKDRIEKIIRGELIGEATAKVVQAVQATVVMLTTIPAVTTVTSS